MYIKLACLGSLIVNIITLVALFFILKLDVIRAELYKEMVLRFGSANVIFLGDSLTRRNSDLALSLGLLRLNTLNYAVDGYTIQQVNQVLDDKTLPQRPCLVVVMAGTNRQEKDSIESNVAAYQRILNKTIENKISIIVLQTPLTQKSDLNDYIHILNKQIESLTEQHSIPFFQTNLFIANKQGLKDEYSIDGVHMNNRGYDALNAVLIPFLKQHYSPMRQECNNIF